MEFIRANYPQERQVLVDGQPAGPTNTSLGIGDPGFYDIALSPPPDFTPTVYEQQLVEGTSSISPAEFDFTPLAPTAAAQTDGDSGDGDDGGS